jgi:hypothetical protein
MAQPAHRDLTLIIKPPLNQIRNTGYVCRPCGVYPQLLVVPPYDVYVWVIRSPVEFLFIVSAR